MPVRDLLLRDFQEQQQQQYKQEKEVEEEEDKVITMRSKDTLMMTELTSISISNSNSNNENNSSSTTLTNNNNNNNNNTTMLTTTEEEEEEGEDEEGEEEIEGKINSIHCQENKEIDKKEEKTEQQQQEEEIEVEENSEIFKCTLCNLDLELCDYFIHGTEIHGFFSCLYCHEQFKFSKELMLHLNREHKLNIQKFNSGTEFLDRGGNDTTLLCVECNKSIQSEGIVSFMKYHSHECRKTTGICPKCGSVQLLSLLGEHILQCVGQMNVNLHGSTTITTSQLRSRDNSCKYCGKKFSPSKIAAHIRACSARNSKLDYGHSWNHSSSSYINNNTYTTTANSNINTLNNYNIMNNNENPVVKSEYDNNDIQIDVIKQDNNNFNHKLKTLSSTSSSRKQQQQQYYNNIDEPSISISKVKDGTVIQNIGGSEILRKVASSSTSIKGSRKGRVQQQKNNTNNKSLLISSQKSKILNTTTSSSSTNNNNNSKSLVNFENNDNLYYNENSESVNDPYKNDTTTISSSLNYFTDSSGKNKINDKTVINSSVSKNSLDSFSLTNSTTTRLDEYLDRNLSPSSSFQSTPSTEYIPMHATEYDEIHHREEDDDDDEDRLIIDDSNFTTNSTAATTTTTTTTSSFLTKKERKRKTTIKKEKKEIKLDPLLLETDDDKRLSILINELAEKLNEKQIEIQNSLLQQQLLTDPSQLDNKPFDAILPSSTAVIPTTITPLSMTPSSTPPSIPIPITTTATTEAETTTSLLHTDLQVPSQSLSDNSQQTISTINETSDSLSLQQPSTISSAPPKYELIVNYSLGSRTDDDILNEMILKSSVDCAYCRLVKLIRIDKRQLVIHLLSKHSWDIRVVRTTDVIPNPIPETKHQLDNEKKSNDDNIDISIKVEAEESKDEETKGVEEEKQQQQSDESTTGGNLGEKGDREEEVQKNEEQQNGINNEKESEEIPNGDKINEESITRKIDPSDSDISTNNSEGLKTEITEIDSHSKSDIADSSLKPCDTDEKGGTKIKPINQEISLSTTTKTMDDERMDTGNVSDLRNSKDSITSVMKPEILNHDQEIHEKQQQQQEEDTGVILVNGDNDNNMEEKKDTDGKHVQNVTDSLPTTTTTTSNDEAMDRANSNDDDDNNSNLVTKVEEERDKLLCKKEEDEGIEESHKEQDEEKMEQQQQQDQQQQQTALLPLMNGEKEEEEEQVDENLKWDDFKLALLKKVFHAPNIIFSFTHEQLGDFGEIPCECLLCGWFIDSQKNLFPHWRKIHRGVAMKCTMCKGKFLFAGALYSHLCLGTPEPLTFTDIADEHEGSSDTIGLRYQCSICENRQLPGFFNYMVHLRKDHNKCELCLETLKNQKDLEHHMKKHKLNHFCWKCSVTYCAKPNFMTHLFWKHGTESVDCSKCLKKKWPHIYHFCVPPEYFICDVCGLYFTKPKALIVHRRLHTGEKLKRCPKTSCQERFISKKLLQKHLETVHVKQPLPTPIIVPALTFSSTGIPSSETPITTTSEMPLNENQIDNPIETNTKSELQPELNKLNQEINPVHDTSAPIETDKNSQLLPPNDNVDTGTLVEKESGIKSTENSADKCETLQEGEDKLGSSLTENKSENNKEVDHLKITSIQSTLDEAETQKLDADPNSKVKVNGIDHGTCSISDNSESETEETEKITSSQIVSTNLERKFDRRPSETPPPPIKIKLGNANGLSPAVIKTPIQEKEEEEKNESSSLIEKSTKREADTSESLSPPSKRMKHDDSSSKSDHSSHEPTKRFNLAEIQGPNLSEDESESEEDSDDSFDAQKDSSKPTAGGKVEIPQSYDDLHSKTTDDGISKSDTTGSLFPSSPFKAPSTELSTDNLPSHADLDDLNNILSTNLDDMNQKQNTTSSITSAVVEDKNKNAEPNLNQSSMEIDDIDGLPCSKKPNMSFNIMNLDDGDGMKQSDDFGSMSPLLSPLDDFNFSVPEIPTFEENHLPEHIIRENALFSIQHEHDYCQPRHQLGLKRKAVETLSLTTDRLDSTTTSPTSTSIISPSKTKKLKVMSPKKLSKKRRRSSSSSSSSSSSCSSCGSNCSCSSGSSSSGSSSSSSSGSDSSDNEDNNKLKSKKEKKLKMAKKNRSPIKLTLPVIQKVKRKVGRPRKINNGNVIKPPTEKRPRGAPRKYNKKGPKIPKTTIKLKKKGDENTKPLGPYIMESDLETEDSGSEETFHIKQLTEVFGTGSSNNTKPSTSIPDTNLEDIWNMNNEKYLLKLVRGVENLEELRPPPPPPTPSPPPTPVKVKKEKSIEKTKYSLKSSGGSDSKLKVRNVPIKPLIVKRNVHSNFGNSVAGNFSESIRGGGESYSLPNTIPAAATSAGKPSRRRTKIGTGKGGKRTNTSTTPIMQTSYVKYDPSVSYIGHNVKEEQSDFDSSSIADPSLLSTTAKVKGGRGSRGGARNRTKKVKPIASKVKKIDEKLYCLCQCPHDNVSQMIGCDAKDCKYKWYHFECVGVVIPPPGKWYCPDCRAALREKKKAAKIKEQEANQELQQQYQVLM